MFTLRPFISVSLLPFFSLFSSTCLFLISPFQSFFLLHPSLLSFFLFFSSFPPVYCTLISPFLSPHDMYSIFPCGFNQNKDDLYNSLSILLHKILVATIKWRYYSLPRLPTLWKQLFPLPPTLQSASIGKPLPATEREKD